MKKAGLILLLFTLFSTLFAQDNSSSTTLANNKFAFTINTGISAPINGNSYWNSDWKSNYLLAFSGYYTLNKNELIGIRLCYDHWLPNEFAITGNISNFRIGYFTNPDYQGIVANYAEAANYLGSAEWSEDKGQANIIELMPSFRYILVHEYMKSNLFLQFSAGMCYYSASWNFSGNSQILSPQNSVQPPPQTLLREYYYSYSKSYTFIKPALSLGMGIKAGYAEILPLYNIILTAKSPTQYFSINLGFNF